MRHVSGTALSWWVMLGRVGVLAALWAHTALAGWSVAANPHFEVYSNAAPESARSTLDWMERLRAWLIEETGLRPDRLRPARVIGFATRLEYAPFRLRETADAYYIGTESRDYIVLPLEGSRAAGVAAHEYAHMALHSAGLKLPPWLGEGLADVFSEAAGGESGHRATLRRETWIPVAELLRIDDAVRERQSAARNSLFYAESAALAGMLVFSPGHRGKLPPFVAAVAAGTPGEVALATIYGKTPAQLESELRSWVERAAAARPAPPAPASAPTATVAEVAPDRMRVLLATLLLDAGERGRAAALYRALPQDDGDVQAGLGLIAWHDGDREIAREHWRRAIALGTRDDALCFRYAMLAENAGAPSGEVRAALQRAVAIRPDFDDARFQLALLDKNEERFEDAIAHLRAMREVAPERAFSWWSALSDALNSAGQFREAEEAAEHAARHATTTEERLRAAEQAHVARTEVVVQLKPDDSGRPRMVTTRVPRGAAGWNPFIDPRDDVRRGEGALREIDCSGPETRFVVEIAGARVALSVPDPKRVQMIHAPDEFTCGAQDGRAVGVVYAARPGGGILRGIEFRQADSQRPSKQI